MKCHLATKIPCFPFVEIQLRKEKFGITAKFWQNCLLYFDLIWPITTKEAPTKWHFFQFFLSCAFSKRKKTQHQNPIYSIIYIKTHQFSNAPSPMYTDCLFFQNFMVFASFLNVDKTIQVIFSLLILNILSEFIMLFRYHSLAIFPHRMFSVVFRCFHLSIVLYDIRNTI